MARIIARNASLGIDDSAATCRALSGMSNTVTLTMSAEAPEITSFGETYRTRLQDGIKDWELTADIFFASAANEADAVLAGILGGSTRFVLGPAGSTTTLLKYEGLGILTNYEMTFGVADAGQGSLTMVARSGSLTRTTFT